MNASPWMAYRPTEAEPWNLERAWTLRRRAGFAATWAELERDLADGPEKAVGRVLDGTCRTQGVPPDFAKTAGLLGDAAAGSSDARRLQAWWLFRCLFTPNPLQERLTLAWHDHFATGDAKVQDKDRMANQNKLLRQSCVHRGASASLSQFYILHSQFYRGQHPTTGSLMQRRKSTRTT